MNNNQKLRMSGIDSSQTSYIDNLDPTSGTPTFQERVLLTRMPDKILFSNLALYEFYRNEVEFDQI